MPTDILMPALEPGMTRGRVARWLVAEGARVSSGHVIAELEVGGAVVEVVSEDQGTLARILAPAGSADIVVDQPIAVLLTDGKTRTRRDPVTRRASPLARRLAREAGVALDGLGEGSGPKGRLVARDVAAALAVVEPGEGAERAPPARHRAPSTDEALFRSSAFASVAGLPGGVASGSSLPSEDERVLAHYPRGSYDLVPHDRLRRLVATTARIAQATVPQFTLSVDVRADALLAARERINAGAPGDGEGLRITVTDLLVKAVALALQHVPEANAAWTELGMLRHKTCDVGVAVAVDGGLVMPVIRQADLKPLSEISVELRALRDRAERRRLTLEECRGGAAGISNLGMMGISRCTALINPPHATMLAVGAAELRPLVEGERVAVVPQMTCSLNADQRVLDAAVAAAFLNAVRSLVEEPLRMLV